MASVDQNEQEWDAVKVKETTFNGNDLMGLANDPNGQGSVELRAMVEEVSQKATGTLFMTAKPNLPEKGAAADKKIGVETPRFGELIKGPVGLKVAVNAKGEIQNVTAIPDKKNGKSPAFLPESPLASALRSAGMTMEE